MGGGASGQGDYKKYMDYQNYTQGAQQGGDAGQGDYSKYMATGLPAHNGAKGSDYKKYEDKYMHGDSDHSGDKEGDYQKYMSKYSGDYQKYVDNQNYAKQGEGNKDGASSGDYHKYMDYSKYMGQYSADKDSTVIFQ